MNFSPFSELFLLQCPKPAVHQSPWCIQALVSEPEPLPRLLVSHSIASRLASSSLFPQSLEFLHLNPGTPLFPASAV